MFSIQLFQLFKYFYLKQIRVFDKNKSKLPTLDTNHTNGHTENKKKEKKKYNKEQSKPVAKIKKERVSNAPTGIAIMYYPNDRDSLD